MIPSINIKKTQAREEGTELWNGSGGSLQNLQMGMHVDIKGFPRIPISYHKPLFEKHGGKTIVQQLIKPKNIEAPLSLQFPYSNMFLNGGDGCMTV